MAAKKKSEVVEEAPEAVVTPAVEPKVEEATKEATVSAPKPTGKVRPAGIGPGRIVLFTRVENTQTGSKTVQHAAMILGDASEASNFKPEDAAVDLKVFTRHGDEVKSGIMYSEEYKPGAWSFPKKV